MGCTAPNAAATQAPSLAPTPLPTTVPTATSAATAPGAFPSLPPRDDLASRLRPLTVNWRPPAPTLVFASPGSSAEATLLALPIASSSTPVRLASVTSGVWQIRPDGSALALSFATSTDSARIATVDLRSGSTRWVSTDEPGVRQVTPVWSADGQAIYYSASRTSASSLTDLGIFRIGADGSANARVHGPDGNGAELLGLTPDGAGLRWSRIRAGGSLDVLDLATGDDRQAQPNEAASEASWRAARPRALVVTGICCAGPVGGNGTLWLWDDVAGTSQMLLGPKSDPPVAAVAASWDPAGSRIVAVVYDRSSGFGTRSSLVTIDAAGGDRKAVAGTEGASVPLWTPAGIVFLRATSQGGTEIMLVSPAGGTTQTLYTDARPIGRLALINP